MADQSGLTPWPVERIPDSDSLYMRVHRAWLKPNGNVARGAFQNHGRGMSTDWSKYSTAEDTRGRGKSPPDNAVVRMVAGQVRAIPGQRVEHSPLLENRAHADVVGEKDTEIRVLLGRIAEFLFRPE